MKSFILHLMVAVFVMSWCSSWLAIGHKRAMGPCVEQATGPEAEDTTPPEVLEEVDDDELTREAEMWAMVMPAAALLIIEARQFLVFKSHVREINGPPPRAVAASGLA
ncbi:MAG: hypothetical protein MUC38_12495 [Cyclobacteriaceae bacterium]|nr:hypothetical protein [Cyclobacteriaceae bacterium]